MRSDSDRVFRYIDERYTNKLSRKKTFSILNECCKISLECFLYDQIIKMSDKK